MRHPAIVVWYPSAVPHLKRWNFGGETDHDGKRSMGPTMVNSDFHEREQRTKDFLSVREPLQPSV